MNFTEPGSPNVKDLSFSDFMESPSGKDVTFMRHYLAQFLKKRDHQKFLCELPATVQRRILALKKLQMETLELDAEFHRKVYAMENEFQQQHGSVFQKRLDIIMGKHEPLEDEILEHQMSKLNLKEEGDENSTKGIPDFWLTIFKYVPKLSVLVKDTDEEPLKNLIDIKIKSQFEPNLSFTLDFHFMPNDYFSNAILSKEYLMKCSPQDAQDYFSFDGPEIYATKGTDIEWKTGKNLVATKQEDGQEVKIQSFFNFFSPPELPEDTESPLFDAINAILSADFEIGHFIKDRIVPRAVLFYTGELTEQDDDESMIADSNLEMVFENDEDEEEAIADEEKSAVQE